MRTLPRLLSCAAALAIASAGPLAVRQLGAQQGGSQQPTAEVQAWQIIRPPQSSLVLARDGSLIGEIGTQ